MSTRPLALVTGANRGLGRAVAEALARSIEEGAHGILWATALAAGEPTGGFFQDGKAIPW